MFLFLLTYGLFLSSSFFLLLYFLFCHRAAKETELCCFPFGQTPAGVLLARNEWWRITSTVPKAGWTPPKLCDVMLSQGDGCVPLSSQHGCHHKTSLSLAQSCFFVASLWERKGTDNPASQKKGSASFSLSCCCDIIRVGWVTFGCGAKPRNVAKQNKISMFLKINSSVHGSGLVHYFHSKTMKAIIFYWELCQAAVPGWQASLHMLPLGHLKILSLCFQWEIRALCQQV